jgi:hypothetical protein
MQLMHSLTLFIAATWTSLAAQGRRVDFESETVGRPPSGFAFYRTREVGAAGKWLVQEEAGNKYLAQLEADRTRNRFPVAVVLGVRATNVDLSVRFKPVSGRVDKAAGLVWRYQDENNYYLVRANANEDNVVVYKVQDGTRTDLPVKGERRSYGKSSRVPVGEWGTLRIVATGSLIQVYHNGTKLFEVDDSTFTGPGAVGVWTKADSVTYFDDLIIDVG